MKIALLASLLGLVAFTAVSEPASAARTGVTLTLGDITIIGTVGETARIFIGSGTVSGTTPACSTAGRQNHFAMNLATNKGRALLSLATAAMLSGKTINVTGLDTCLAVGGNNYQILDQLSLNN